LGGGNPVGATAWGVGGGGPVGGDNQSRLGGGQRGVTAPRVSGSEKKLGSDYYISGDELPRYWMVALSHGGYNIYGWW
jgi:hypothetical protein